MIASSVALKPPAFAETERRGNRTAGYAFDRARWNIPAASHRKAMAWETSGEMTDGRAGTAGNRQLSEPLEILPISVTQRVSAKESSALEVLDVSGEVPMSRNQSPRHGQANRTPGLRRCGKTRKTAPDSKRTEQRDRDAYRQVLQAARCW